MTTSRRKKFPVDEGVPMELDPINQPGGIPNNIPVSNEFSAWTEYILAADLGRTDCPVCRKEIPGSFMFFRPHGMEFWRCLLCLARTHHGSALYMPRVTRTGEGADDAMVQVNAGYDDPGF